MGAARFSGRAFPDMRWGEGGKEVCGVRRGQCYPGEAPSASATRRKVGRKGKDAGRCTITRRTETSTRAPSFSNRSPRTVGACGSQAQLLHQHISGGGQQHAELVGPEIAATGAVDLQLVQFLDPVLDLTALAVNLFVDPLRALLQVGNDEARVVFGLFAVGTHDLGFEEDAAFSRP